MTANILSVKNMIRFVAIGLLVVTAGCKKQSVFQDRERPQLILTADDPRLLENNIRFNSDTVYVLAGNLVIKAGQILQVEAGTIVKVNNRISLTISEGGKIEAKGTADKPIVFTSSAAKGGAGVGTGTSGGERWWYGITVNGNLLNHPELGSSGTLSYVRIEFAGGNTGSSGTPALTLQDVSKETVIHHVQISYTFYETAFRISGGNFNASELVSYASSNSDFYIDGGYKGKLQNLLAYRHPYFPFSGSDGTGGPDFGGLLIDGAETFPEIANFSAIGPGIQNGVSLEYKDTITPGPFGSGRRVAALIVKGGKFHIRNSVFMGFWKGGFYMDNKESAVSLNNNESSIKNSLIHADDGERAFFLGPTVFPPFTSADFRNLVLRPEYSNKQLLNYSDFHLKDPFDYNNKPDPFPEATAEQLTGAAFDGVFDDPFFKKVAWRGALGTDNWLQGWTNFKPLQTDYNN